MESNSYHFTIDLPGGLSDNQIESVLPSFILIHEKSCPYPRIDVAQEIRLMKWDKSRMQNGEWLVNIDWQRAS